MLRIQTYIVKNPATGLVKIGKTRCPHLRIASLERELGEKLECLAILDVNVESELHARFASSRIEGEWFTLTPDLEALTQWPEVTGRVSRPLIASTEAVLLVCVGGGERSGREVQDEWERRCGKRMPIGSFYSTMQRMEAKGLVVSRQGEATPCRAGNRPRYYTVTTEGAAQAIRFRRAICPRR